MVDLCLERGFERFVGIVSAEKIGVTNEEGFFVVVGVDEPAGNAFGAVAADFAGVGVEDVDAVDLDRDLAVAGVEDVDVGFAEDHEQVALAGVLQVFGHVQVGVHARFQHRDAAEFVELGGMGVVVEGAGDQHIEARVAGLTRGGDQVGAGDGAEFGADEDGSAFFSVAFSVRAASSVGDGNFSWKIQYVLFISYRIS